LDVVDVGFDHGFSSRIDSLAVHSDLMKGAGKEDWSLLAPGAAVLSGQSDSVVLDMSSDPSFFDEDIASESITTIFHRGQCSFTEESTKLFAFESFPASYTTYLPIDGGIASAEGRFTPRDSGVVGGISRDLALVVSMVAVWTSSRGRRPRRESGNAALPDFKSHDALDEIFNGRGPKRRRSTTAPDKSGDELLPMDCKDDEDDRNDSAGQGESKEIPLQEVNLESSAVQMDQVIVRAEAPADGSSSLREQKKEHDTQFSCGHHIEVQAPRPISNPSSVPTVSCPRPLAPEQIVYFHPQDVITGASNGAEARNSLYTHHIRAARPAYEACLRAGCRFRQRIIARVAVAAVRTSGGQFLWWKEDRWIKMTEEQAIGMVVESLEYEIRHHPLPRTPQVVFSKMRAPLDFGKMVVYAKPTEHCTDVLHPHDIILPTGELANFARDSGAQWANRKAVSSVTPKKRSHDESMGCFADTKIQQRLTRVKGENGNG
jgi:hypothetical protein